MGVQASIYAYVWYQITRILHPLELVCRGGDTQVQVGANLNKKSGYRVLYMRRIIFITGSNM